MLHHLIFERVTFDTADTNKINVVRVLDLTEASTYIADCENL